MKTTSFLLPIFIFLFSSTSSFSNDSDRVAGLSSKNSLHIEGQIIDEDGAIPHAKVLIYEHNEVVGTFTANSNGEFGVVIPLQTKCAIRIVVDGYYDKLLTFDTSDAPMKQRIAAFEFEAFMWKESSFTETEKTDILDFPAALVYYSPKMDGFTYNRTYAKHIKTKYKELLKEAGNFDDLAQEIQ